MKKSMTIKLMASVITLSGLTIGGALTTISCSRNKDTNLKCDFKKQFFQWDNANSSELPTIKGAYSNKDATDLKFQCDHLPPGFELNSSNGQLTTIQNEMLEEEADHDYDLNINVSGKTPSSDKKTIYGSYIAKVHVSKYETLSLTKITSSTDLKNHNLVFTESGYNGGGDYYSFVMFNTNDKDKQTEENISAVVTKYKIGGSHYFGIKIGNGSYTIIANGKSGEHWSLDHYLLPNGVNDHFYPSASENKFYDVDSTTINLNFPYDISNDSEGPMFHAFYHQAV